MFRLQPQPLCRVRPQPQSFCSRQQFPQFVRQPQPQPQPLLRPLRVSPQPQPQPQPFWQPQRSRTTQQQPQSKGNRFCKLSVTFCKKLPKQELQQRQFVFPQQPVCMVQQHIVSPLTYKVSAYRRILSYARRNNGVHGKGARRVRRAPSYNGKKMG